jgi:hypothetical protein
MIGSHTDYSDGGDNTMPDHDLELKPTISRETFAALHGYELGQELINPAIGQVRGKNLEIKRDIYQWLTPGQRVLFAFWVLYGHTRSGWLQFFLEGLYVGGYEQFLPMIKAGLRQVDAEALLENITAAEKLIAGHRASLQAEPDADLEKIQHEFAPLDERLFSLLPETMTRIEAQIRALPEEFVLFTN